MLIGGIVALALGLACGAAALFGEWSMWVHGGCSLGCINACFIGLCLLAARGAE